MQSLLDVRFPGERWPNDWIEVDGSVQIDDDGLNIAEYLNWAMPIPGHGWRRFALQIEAQALTPGPVVFTDVSRCVTVDLAHGVHEIGTYRQVPVVTAMAPIAPRPEGHCVTFAWDHDRIQITVDDVVVMEGRDPSPGPMLGLCWLRFAGDWRVRRVHMLGDAPLLEPYRSYPARRSTDFQLQVAIDFNSDVKRAPWTAQMLDRMFHQFRDWGVRRCDWIWHGDGDEWANLWVNVQRPNARATVASMERIFPHVVRSAHAHDIELFGLLKPFEIGELERFAAAVGSEQAAQCLMARKPGACGAAPARPWTRIDLVKEDAAKAAFSVGDVRLLVSDDNIHYVPYEGPMQREERVEAYPVWEHTAGGGRDTGTTRLSRVMRFTGLRTTKPFLLLATPPGKASFANDLVNLIHVFSDGEEDRLITLGVSSRLQSVGMFEQRESSVALSECQVNFGQTTILRQPSANFPGFNAMGTRHVLDAREGIIAMSRGKAVAERVMSPSCPAARDWWLSRIQCMLDDGADGIELRVRNHQSPLTWAEIGFEPEVRDAYRERYGIDLWATDDFDKAAWRRIRGEAYTTFCRQASELVRARGKRLGLHIGPIQMLDPEVGAAMDIHWDWRTWIDQGLADSVTMKELFPHTRMAEDVLFHTRRQGIPVIFSPYGNTIWSQPDPLGICDRRCQLARDHGFDGFQFYESAALVKASVAGEVTPAAPALDAVFSRHFGSSAAGVDAC